MVSQIRFKLKNTKKQISFVVRLLGSFLTCKLIEDASVRHLFLLRVSQGNNDEKMKLELDHFLEETGETDKIENLLKLSSCIPYMLAEQNKRYFCRFNSSLESQRSPVSFWIFHLLDLIFELCSQLHSSPVLHDSKRYRL